MNIYIRIFGVHYLSDKHKKGSKGTVVNRTLSSLRERSLKITLTVSLTIYSGTLNLMNSPNDLSKTTQTTSRDDTLKLSSIVIKKCPFSF